MGLNLAEIMGSRCGLVALLTISSLLVSSSWGASMCYKCVQCYNATSMWHDDAITDLSSSLGSTDSIGMYMQDVDDISGLETLFGGACPSDVDTIAAPELTNSGTMCLRAIFTARASDYATSKNSLSCVVLGGLEVLFLSISAANKSETDYLALIDGLSAEDIAAELQAGLTAAGGYEAEAPSSDITLCDTDKCNYFPTNDKVSMATSCGAWNADYLVDGSDAKNNLDALTNSLCTQMESQNPGTVVPGSCMTSVAEGADPSAKRAKRSTVAVVTLTVEMPPMSGMTQETVGTAFTSAATSAQAEQTANGNTLATSLVLTAEVEEIDVGGESAMKDGAVPLISSILSLTATLVVATQLF